MKVNKVVLQEVKQAYADCWMKRQQMGMKTRNLNFIASEFVSVEEAEKIMEKCIVYYNNFEPKLLKLLPKNSTVKIAREGSVALYVTCNKKPVKKMKFDECRQVSTGYWRLWWD